MKGQVKRLVAAGLIYTIGVVSVAFASYVLEHRRIIEDIDARLLAAATNLPSLLPENFHDIARTADAISPEQDRENLELLTSHATTSDMTYIYSYVMVDGEIYFTSCNYTQADVEKNQVVTYWTDYPEGAAEYYQAMTAEEPIYVTAGDRWGMFRTILMPMTSPAGLPYVSAADMDITVIEESLRRNILAVLGLSLLLIFLVIPLVWAYNRTYSEMNNKLQLLNDQLKDDIATAHRLQQELQQANLQVEQASRVKSQFLSNMSHELRTPINGIVGTNHLLLETPLDAEQKELIDICSQSAHILLETVNQILDTAAIEADGIVLKPQFVMSRNFFDELAKMFSAKAAENKLDLIIDVDPSVPAGLMVDELRFRQVFINLIANALKFTKVGGVTVSISWSKGRLIGRVEDTGIGIPVASQQLVFEMFQQVDGSNSRRHDGTGLGLSIASRICQLMHGDLKLVRSDEQGSLFEFKVVVEEAGHSFSVVGADSVLFTASSAAAVIAPGLLADWLGQSLGSEAVMVNDLQKLTVQAGQAIIYDLDLGQDGLASLIQQYAQRHKIICLIWPGTELPVELTKKIELIRKPFTSYRLQGLIS
jgi:signal transduction histidine kinase